LDPEFYFKPDPVPVPVNLNQWCYFMVGARPGARAQQGQAQPAEQEEGGGGSSQGNLSS